MTFSWTNPQIYNGDNNIFPLRDPFILKEGDVWYMTGTLPPYGLREEAARTKGVPLYKSSDLKNWTFIDHIVKTPAEAEGKWYSERFWAPEIFLHNGIYYLTVNCCQVDGENHGFLFAKADHIEGPYTLMNPDAPFKLGNDAHLFADDDGEVYLFASGIWMSKIDLENLRLLTDITYPVTPIPDSDAWNALREKVGFEGPYVLKYDQKYYMFYSTWARGYEVGIAAADTPDGEWNMYPQPMYGAIDQNWCNEYGGIYEDNYYTAQDKYGQCGQNCAFEGADGGIWIAAHAYDVGVDNFMDVKFVMDKLTFDDERGILAVDTLTGKTVNGPTWGELSVECGTPDSAYNEKTSAVTPLYALNVHSYALQNSVYKLPAKADIRLSNSFRVCAPVTWHETVNLTVCGDQKICGTAVYQGIEYPVQAVVTVVDAL